MSEDQVWTINDYYCIIINLNVIDVYFTHLIRIFIKKLHQKFFKLSKSLI
jgi:hypothetical protein